MNSREIEEQAARWLTRRESGPWDEGAQSELDAWLQTITHRVAFLRLEAAWRDAERLKALAAGLPPRKTPPRDMPTGLPAVTSVVIDPPPSDEPWSDLRFAPVRSPPARPRRRTMLALGVTTLAGAMVATVAMAPLHRPPAPGPARQVYESAPGTLHAVALADGSRSTLGGDTRIDVELRHAERHVELRHGEAIFDVAKDPARPFVVQAGARRIVAVGTRFSVRRDAAALRVVVTEGTVRLETDPAAGHREPSILMPAGSIAVAQAQGVRVQTAGLAEAEKQLEWRSGYLTFTDTPLRQVVAEFNRFSREPLVLADPRLEQLRIGGHFSWKDAQGFARLLERSYPLRAETRDGQVILHAR